jgi:hypothetical protein
MGCAGSTFVEKQRADALRERIVASVFSWAGGSRWSISLVKELLLYRQQSQPDHNQCKKHNAQLRKPHIHIPIVDWEPDTLLALPRNSERRQRHAKPFGGVK